MGKPDTRIGDLMEENIVTVDIGDDQEEVARKVARFDLLAIPVVLGDVNAWQLGLVIGQAVAIVCLWGTRTGSLLPIIFNRLGFDPGFASFVDVTGIVIYFNIAQAYLLH
jgi:Mg/Co/Ni transporter MgtE